MTDPTGAPEVAGLVAALIAEMERQKTVQFTWLRDNGDGTVEIDGGLDVAALARAALTAMEKQDGPTDQPR